jgi:hypothetical protein
MLKWCKFLKRVSEWLLSDVETKIAK